MIRKEDASAFHRDGAIKITGVLDDGWLEILADGLDECFEEPDGMSSDLVMQDTMIRVDQFPASRSNNLQKFIHESPVGGLVESMIGTQVRFYMDQMFVKPAGELMATAWHQDTCYYNVEGDDLIRVWVSPDPVPRGASLEVIRGSHNWNVTYRPLVGRDPSIPDEEHQTNLEKAREFGFYERSGKDFAYNDAILDTSLPEIPNIESMRESFDIIGWDYEPGDVILFHGNAIHAACNDTVLDYPRRAHAIMYAGPNVRYVKRVGQVIPDPEELDAYRPQTGQQLSEFGDTFPLINSREGS
ncbi:MAG: phytanoyl-CoA dioxygenase family protein [Actinomycetota bacterium]|nr:phytanoyl-CoA dioxygenase family protein [Actinomycetota bacterium]